MVGQRAAKTEAVFTSTMNGWNNTIELALFYAAFDGVHALWRWTPLQVLFVIHIRPGEQDFIAVFDVVRYQQFQRLCVHNAVATISWTFDPCSFALLLHFLCKVMSVTVGAVAVAALHGIGLHICIVLVANLTGESLHEPCAWRLGEA